MTNELLINWVNEQKTKVEFIVFPEELLAGLNYEQTKLLAEYFGSDTLMQIPESEIRFFEWLKQADEPVWNDMWESEETAPYIVGMSFLPKLLNKTRGFPICDLVSNENYYFTAQHLVGKDSDFVLESIQKRFLAKESLTIPQLFMLEITIAPIDIWRFAYNHRFDVQSVKDAVAVLVEDKILVHLTDAEHLAHFIDF